jgi:cystathionine beta-lyase/cystathionine gamma-synthase
MSKNTSDALRLLKIRLNNQKLSALAITNQLANQNEIMTVL